MKIMQKITTKISTRTLVIAFTSIMVGTATLVSLINLFSQLPAVANSPSDPGCYEFNINGPLTKDPAILSLINNADSGACFLTPGTNGKPFDCWDSFGLFNNDATFAKCKQYTVSASGRHYYCPNKDCPTAVTPPPPVKITFYHCPRGSTYCNVGEYYNENECKTANRVTRCYTDYQACQDICLSSIPPPPPPPPPPPGNPYYFCANYSATVCSTINFKSKQACQDQIGLPCFDTSSQCSTRSTTNCGSGTPPTIGPANYYSCKSSTDTACSYEYYNSLTDCQRTGRNCYTVKQKGVCTTNISKDCPPPTTQPLWWCDTASSCKSNTSGATPPAGAQTHPSQEECITYATTECQTTTPPPPPPINFYWCNPNSASTCNTNTTGCPSGKKCYTSASSCSTNYSKDCPAVSTQTGCCVYGFFKQSGQMTQAQCNAKLIHKWCGINTTCASSSTCGGVQPKDLCPNITGVQDTMPSGKVADASGNCVNLVWWYDVNQGTCISGPKTSAPAGSTTYNSFDECKTASAPPPGNSGISGTVKAESSGDFPTSGGVISGASILLSKGTSQIGPKSSDSSGNFSFTKLADGQYNMQISASGYITYCGQANAPSSGKTYSLFPIAQPNNGSEGGNWDCKNGRPPLKPAMQAAVACLIDKTNEILGNSVKLKFTSFGRCNANGSVDCHSLGLAADFIPMMNGSSFLQNCQPFLNIAGSCGLYFIDERKDPIILGSCGSNTGPFKSGAHYHTQIGQSCSANNLPPNPPPYTCNQ